MSEDIPTEKRCTKCGEMKTLDAFVKAKGGKHGRKSQCKACTTAYSVAYRAANPEKSQAYYRANAETIRARMRAYNITNADKKHIYYAAYAKAHRQPSGVNSEKHSERKKAYYQANAEARREYQRAYYAANAEALREKKRIYRAENPHYYRKHRDANPDLYRAIKHRRRARLKGNGGIFTTRELKDMRKTQAGICAYCERQHNPDKLSIDHVIPLQQGGRHDAANIVLACLKCNSSKNNRTPEQWTNRWYERKRKDDQGT